MTDRCAPSDGSPSGWYWIDMSRGPHLARWNADRQVWWPIDRGGITPFEMQHSGYRYLHPCRPNDAEARERLEAENKRLRDLIHAILAADERGQGLPFATAMDAAREAVDGKNT